MTKPNDNARKSRLEGSELSKLNLKGKSLKEMEAMIRAAKAKANEAYTAGKDVAPKPVGKLPQGRDKAKREQMLRRAEEASTRASRLKAAKDAREPNPKPSSKPKPSSRPSSRVGPAAPNTAAPNRRLKASEKIRRMQNTVPDALRIHPGMGTRFPGA
jgi:hypothetical protein